MSGKKAVARHEVAFALEERDFLPDGALNISPFGGFSRGVNENHEIAEGDKNRRWRPDDYAPP